MFGVQKRFGATVALDGVDLAVPSGIVHALVGENGAGKSTLMKVLSGAIQPDAGTMRIDGQAYAPRNPLEARRTGIAMIYQELSLAPHLNVEDNITLGMEPGKLGVIDHREVRRRVTDALRQLEHSEINPQARVGSLSVAAQQLVEIARALAVGCRVLVFDEPTSSLTLRDIERLFTLIQRLKEQGHAIVYISHFLEEVLQVADRYTVLRDGRTVGTGDIREVDADALVAMMIGRRVDQLYPRSPRTRGEAVLEVSNLVGDPKPEHASFVLHRGEVFGIAGLMGAGRTELLRTLMGLAPICSGEVRLGAYVGPASPTRRWLDGMGLLSENRKDEGLAVSLSVADNLTLSRLHGLGPARLVLPSRQDAASRRWIDKLGIRCRGPRQPVASLSGGNQQKVAIARLLHHDVDVLLLDEPTRGIDVASKAQIYQLIDALARGDETENRPPRAILMVSSYLPELLGVCDRVAVMCRGTLGSPRPVAEWDEHSLMLEATGHAAAV